MGFFDKIKNMLKSSNEGSYFIGANGEVVSDGVKPFEELPVAERFSGKYDHLLDQKKIHEDISDSKNIGEESDPFVDPRLMEGDLFDAIVVYQPGETPKDPDINLCKTVMKAMQQANHVTDDLNAEKHCFTPEVADMVCELSGKLFIGKDRKLHSYLDKNIARELLLTASGDIHGMEAEDAKGYVYDKLPNMVPELKPKPRAADIPDIDNKIQDAGITKVIENEAPSKDGQSPIPPSVPNNKPDTPPRNFP